MSRGEDSSANRSAGVAVAAARRGRPSVETTRLRQQQLLQVARGVFAKAGYRATTMDAIAAAAGMTKRTVYAWHRDKEALFRACVLAGAERFPKLAPEGAGDESVRATLERYVEDLHRELVKEDSYGLGALFLREAHEFPELAEAMQRGHLDYMIAPLAAYLTRHGLEAEGSIEQAMLFVAMALSPLHNTMLVGMALPDADAVRAHARRCVGVFLQGASLPARQP